MEELRQCFLKVQEQYDAVCEKKLKAEAEHDALQREKEEKMNGLVRDLEEMRVEATAKLIDEVARLQVERDAMSERRVQHADILQLNVGGVLYTTKLSTLTTHADSMLAALFSGRYTLAKDANGAVFIDRDGLVFRYVLNYLRTGRAPARHDLTTFEFEQLCTEADYFGLSGLLELLRAKEQHNVSYAILSHRGNSLQWMAGALLGPALRHPAPAMSTSPAGSGGGGGGGGIFVNPPFVVPGTPAAPAAVPVAAPAPMQAAPVAGAGLRRASRRRVFPVMGQEKTLEEVLDEMMECGWTLSHVAPDVANHATLYVFQRDNDRTAAPAEPE